MKTKISAYKDTLWHDDFFALVTWFFFIDADCLRQYDFKLSEKLLSDLPVLAKKPTAE